VTSLDHLDRERRIDSQKIIRIGADDRPAALPSNPDHVRVDRITRMRCAKHATQHLGYCVGQVNDQGAAQKEGDGNLPPPPSAPHLRHHARRCDQRRTLLRESLDKVDHRALPALYRDERPRVEDDPCRGHAARLRREGFVNLLNMAFARRMSSLLGRTVR